MFKSRHKMKLLQSKETTPSTSSSGGKMGILAMLDNMLPSRQNKIQSESESRSSLVSDSSLTTNSDNQKNMTHKSMIFNISIEF